MRSSAALRVLAVMDQPWRHLSLSCLLDEKLFFHTKHICLYMSIYTHILVGLVEQMDL